MSTAVHSEESERQAKLYHGDGLLDIAIGLAILLAGIGEMFDRISLAGIWVVLWLPIMTSAKQSITVPRMRYVDFTSQPDANRRMRLLVVTVAVALATLLTFGLVVFMKSDLLPSWLVGWIREYGRFVWPVVLVGLGWLIAWATDVKRLYAYAALMVIAFACGYWFKLAVSIVLVAMGGVVLLTGIVILLRFVRRYPVADSSG